LRSFDHESDALPLHYRVNPVATQWLRFSDWTQLVMWCRRQLIWKAFHSILVFNSSFLGCLCGTRTLSARRTKQSDGTVAFLSLTASFPWHPLAESHQYLCQKILWSQCWLDGSFNAHYNISKSTIFPIFNDPNILVQMFSITNIRHY